MVACGNDVIQDRKIVTRTERGDQEGQLAILIVPIGINGPTMTFVIPSVSFPAPMLIVNVPKKFVS